MPPKNSSLHSFGAFDGALLVDKPAGPTSHDVVHRIRRHFQIKKVGHCGTLDPNATGLLIIVLGKSTKLSEQIMGTDKLYSGEIKFGESTNSYDADGENVASQPVPRLTLEDLNRHASCFVGDQLQTPPMVSAVKQGGVPLYKLARKGVEVERKPRLVHIYKFRFDQWEEPLGHFEIFCTKGTYVRTVAHELGQKIGCGAHLHSLRRLASGPFQVEDAVPLEKVMNLTSQELPTRLIPFLRLAELSKL